MSILIASTAQMNDRCSKTHNAILNNDITFQNGRHFNKGSEEHLQNVVPPFRAVTTTRSGRLSFVDITSTAFVRTLPYFLHSPFQAKPTSVRAAKQNSFKCCEFVPPLKAVSPVLPKN